MSMISAVVFDLGGVLVDWNPRYLYREIFGDDFEGMERFLAEIFMTPAWNERLDAGHPWDEVIATVAASRPEYRALLETYRDRWRETLGGPIAGTVAILEELKGAGMPLFALTNWSQYTFPHARERFGFLDWFGDIVVSGEEGLIKPNPEIFEILLARIGFTADRCVFIDDSLKNIEAARALGFHVIHFRDPEQVRRDLGTLGLALQPAEGVS